MILVKSYYVSCHPIRYDTARLPVQNFLCDFYLFFVKMFMKRATSRGLDVLNFQ